MKCRLLIISVFSSVLWGSFFSFAVAEEDAPEVRGLPIQVAPAHLQRGQVNSQARDRVAGISPSFEELAQGLYEKDVPLKEVASSQDIFENLRKKLLGSDATLLIISDHRKMRVLRLEEDRTDQAGSPTLIRTPEAIISP